MIHINGNWQDAAVSKGDLSHWISAVLDHEGMAAAEISISFVTGEEMSALNSRYTGRKGTTDVLAFSQQEGDIPAPDPDLLGDVIVDVMRVREQALQYGVPVTEELLRVTVHGILHLLGYDHDNSKEEIIMREAEESHIQRFKTRTGALE